MRLLPATLLALVALASPLGAATPSACPATLLAPAPEALLSVPLPPFGSCGPGTCIGGSYCDDCLCYAPESVFSRAFCRCNLGDPACGLGECVGNSYCTGPFCADSVCYVETHPLSQVLCGDYELDALCNVVKDCGPGYCLGNSFCDDCQCWAPDAPISQLTCGCGLIDPTCGFGECVGDSWCEGANCAAPVCYIPTHPASRVMCQGGQLSADCRNICFPI
ncbi:MAG: hypothetical protein SF066_18235 [Thermoanaerobaculia bacterium]|nr:hypothetical protein [Thermoanaerobaculia bacterium]